MNVEESGVELKKVKDYYPGFVCSALLVLAIVLVTPSWLLGFCAGIAAGCCLKRLTTR